MRKTVDLIDEIDSMGGSISAIKSGWIENEISRSAYEYQKNIDNKKQIIVGVNKYKDHEDEQIDTFYIDVYSAN